MSRCGSTLAAQMLAALPTNLVLSEPCPIDGVLRAPLRNPHVTDAERLAWLRALVSALGQRRRGEEARLFIKFESWHVFELALIRAAFPDVPWLFLYRDPVEVLVSQVRRRGWTMMPGPLAPRFLGLSPTAAKQMDSDELSARMLAGICSAALHDRAGGLFVDYRELPDAVCDSIADHFNLRLTLAEREEMRRAARFDAKTPQLYFTADSTDKQRQATDRIRDVATRWLQSVYEQLSRAI
jgi:hypothetical protein